MSFIDRSDRKEIADLGFQAYAAIKPYVGVALKANGFYGNANGVKQGILEARQEVQIARRSLRERQTGLCALSASQAGKQACKTLRSGTALFFGLAGLLGLRRIARPQLFYLGKLQEALQHTRTLYRGGAGRQLLASLESVKDPREKLLQWKKEIGIGESEVKERQVVLACSGAIVNKVKVLLEDLPAVEAGDPAADARVDQGLAEIDTLVRDEVYSRKIDLGFMANSVVQQLIAACGTHFKLAATLLAIGGCVAGMGRSLYTSNVVDLISRRLKKGSP